MTTTTILEPIDQYVTDVAMKLRISHDLDYNDFAHILNVSVNFVINVEQKLPFHKYSLIHINILADYFKISPKHFLPRNPMEDLEETIN